MFEGQQVWGQVKEKASSTKQGPRNRGHQGMGSRETIVELGPYHSTVTTFLSSLPCSCVSRVLPSGFFTNENIARALKEAMLP